MNISTFLLALFLPPVYLFTRKKWIGGTFSVALWLIAWVMLISLIAALFSPIPYLLSLFPAMWTLKNEAVDKQTSMLANKIADVTNRVRN